jgi:mono/diheme cytochrome c family protein
MKSKAHYCCAGLISAAFSVAAIAGDGSDSYELVERGRYLAILGDCSACHTVSGQPAFAGGVTIDTPFGKLQGANITPDRETGIGRWSFSDFQNAMTNGHGREGKRLYAAMPFTAYTKVTRDDNLALWAYLRTLEPAHHEVQTNQLPFPFNQRLALAGWNWLNFTEGAFQADPQQSTQWNRGAYLVQGLGHCGSCHTPKNLLGGDNNERFLEGGNLQGWVAPDITGNTHTGVGTWSESDLVQFLKTGANQFDIASGPMAEAVEHSTQYWRESDLMAVAVYLRTLRKENWSAPEPIAPNDSRLIAGKVIYEDQCSACHTPKGEGIGGLFPRLAKAPLVNSVDPDSMIRVVLTGNRAIGTDAAPTAPAMPSFAWNMSDANIANVLTFVRNSWGNAAPAVSEQDVMTLRQKLQR